MNIKLKETKNILFFGTGKLISVFGNAIYTFATGLYILEVTGSGLNFAMSIFLNVCALILFVPIAGVLADRANKRVLVILMDILNGFVFISLFYLSQVYSLTLPMLYVTSFITSGLTTVFSIALDTSVPDMVSDGKLLKMNSIGKIIDSISAIGGPVIAGVVIGFLDIRIFILINGLSFLISALLESWMDFTLYKHEKREKNKIKSPLKEYQLAITYIGKEKKFGVLLILLVLVNFFLSLTITVPLPYIINQVFKMGAKAYGVIQSFLPIGMIIGALLIKHFVSKYEQIDLLKKTILGLALIIVISGLPILTLSHSSIGSDYAFYILYGGIMLLIGIHIAFIDIPIMQFIQREIPRELMGRVLSISMFLVKLVVPIALLISGLLIDHVNVFMIPLIGGSLLFTMIFISTYRNAILDTVKPYFNQTRN